jgi:glycosyltransferase involved in cell wall biosynthesis
LLSIVDLVRDDRRYRSEPMSFEKVPRVSLGMPAYNSEQHIEEALDSLLAQTFGDFEIVISDNASTDRTEEICRAYAERDERIRYVRQSINQGMISNFNSVYRLSRGEYFKWCSSDDVCAPDYLERAVEVLDKDPSVVLVFSLIQGIDENGQPRSYLPGQITDRDSPETVSSPDPVIRFRKLMRHIWWVDAAFYGLMRSDVLAQTSLHRYQRSGDQLLVTEMALRGRLWEIPEAMFFSRYHAKKTSASQKTHRQRAELIENRPLGRGVTAWWKTVRGHPMRLVAYTSFVHGARLTTAQRLKCYYEIVRSVAWWVRLRAYLTFSRVGGFEWLRPAYPPKR